MTKDAESELGAATAGDRNAEKMSKIRVLIADDHAVVRDGLVAMIGEMDGYDGRGGSRKRAARRCTMETASSRRFAAGLADACAGWGWAIDQIRESAAATRIILLTTFDGEEDIYRSIRAGAKAYLLKDAPRDDILPPGPVVLQAMQISPTGSQARQNVCLIAIGANLPCRQLNAP